MNTCILGGYIMDRNDIFKQQIQEMMNIDYCSFIKALISIETGETNKDKLQALYDTYTNMDDVTLMNNFFSK